MTHRLSTAALSLAVLLAGPASGQDAPSAEAIRDAFLASPHARAEDQAFTHWDEDEAVPTDCAICHAGSAFVDFMGGDGSAVGVIDHPVPRGEILDCVTCHNPGVDAMEGVTFPSGVFVDDLGPSAVCAVCHQGRQSSDSVVEATEGLEPDVVAGDLGFLNIHYRAAAATLLGDRVRGGFQYPGRDYAGTFTHVDGLDTCAGCHDPHALEIRVESCGTCHQDADSLRDIRATEADIDGDGDTAEGIAFEIASIHDRLLAAITAYADEVAGAPIVYADSYPYFFADLDGDGVAGADEAAFPNRYQSWTPRLLRAAYNYQFAAKDPGAYAHNPHYVIQLVHDSLVDLSESVDVELAGLVRP